MQECDYKHVYMAIEYIRVWVYFSPVRPVKTLHPFPNDQTSRAGVDH